MKLMGSVIQVAQSRKGGGEPLGVDTVTSVSGNPAGLGKGIAQRTSQNIDSVVQRNDSQNLLGLGVDRSGRQSRLERVDVKSEPISSLGDGGAPSSVGALQGCVLPFYRSPSPNSGKSGREKSSKTAGGGNRKTDVSPSTSQV